jgi:chromosome transmission fidelity protein 18
MEVIQGNDELRRLDASSEPGPENKRARTSGKVDIADKVRMNLYQYVQIVC